MDRIQVKISLKEEISKTEKSIIHYKELTKPIALNDAIGRCER